MLDYHPYIYDMEKQWKDIDNYIGLYKISNHGDVLLLKREWVAGKNLKRLRTERLANQTLKRNGYYAVTLTKNGKQKQYEVHRLVAEHFLDNQIKKRTVNHINGIKTDNRIENLEWATYSENAKHAYRIGLKNQNGSKNPSASKIKLFINSKYLGSWGSIKEAHEHTGISKYILYHKSRKVVGRDKIIHINR